MLLSNNHKCCFYEVCHFETRLDRILEVIRKENKGRQLTVQYTACSRILEQREVISGANL